MVFCWLLPCKQTDIWASSWKCTVMKHFSVTAWPLWVAICTSCEIVIIGNSNRFNAPPTVRCAMYWRSQELPGKYQNARNIFTDLFMNLNFLSESSNWTENVLRKRICVQAGSRAKTYYILLTQFALSNIRHIRCETKAFSPLTP